MLVMLMGMRFVMGANRSRSIHFQEKVTVVNIEEKPSMQSEKFQSGEKTSMVSGLRCAKFPCGK